MLTARAENFLRGNYDLDDTIRRLQAFEKAGADVLMAPGLPDLASVRAVCAALTKPFNFMAGIKGKSFSVAALEAAGVKRISLATSLYRAAMSGMIAAASEVKDKGRLGMGAGGVLFAFAALLGLHALLTTVPGLYAAFKLLGGAYIAWLGWRIWRGAKTLLDITAGEAQATRPARQLSRRCKPPHRKLARAHR